MPIVPTLFTLLNGVLGFLSILYSAKYGIYHTTMKVIFLQKAAWMIIASIFLDAFDGEVARLLKQQSNFGAELDSLNDAISFGVAPAVLIYVWAHLSFKEFDFPPVYSRILYIFLTLYVMGVIIRLARFNVETSLDTESHKIFKGLPSPAGGGLLASLVILQIGLTHPPSFIYQVFGKFLSDLQINNLNMVLYWLLPFLLFSLAYLMVSNIRYPHAMLTIFGDRPKIQYFLYALTVLGTMWIIREISFFLFFLLYILTGPAVLKIQRGHKR